MAEDDHRHPIRAIISKTCMALDLEPALDLTVLEEEALLHPEDVVALHLEDLVAAIHLPVEVDPALVLPVVQLPWIQV